MSGETERGEWGGQKGVSERWALVAGSRAPERAGAGAAGTRVEVHDGSLPPPISTAGGSFSRGLHSRDHQAFSEPNRLYHREERSGEQTCCEAAYGAAAPRLGWREEGTSGFLMDRDRNNTAPKALRSDKLALISALVRKFATLELSATRTYGAAYKKQQPNFRASENFFLNEKVTPRFSSSASPSTFFSSDITLLERRFFFFHLLLPSFTYITATLMKYQAVILMYTVYLDT